MSRRLVVGTAGLALAALVAVGIVATTGGHQKATSVRPSTTSPVTVPGKLPIPHSTLHVLSPVSNPPPPEPLLISPSTERQISLQVEASPQSAGTLRDWSEARAMALPRPATSPEFPPLPPVARTSPDIYIPTVVRELFDLDFAKQSRPVFLSWVQSEMSPDTLPDVPAALRDRLTVASVVFAGEEPWPDAATWATLAAEHQTWHVSGVSVTTSPTWQQVVASGWQPPDTRMWQDSVTATLVKTWPGHGTRAWSLSMRVMVGSARYHHGLGLVGVSHVHLVGGQYA